MLKENEQMWANCSKIIRDNVGEAAYNAWFAPLKPVGYENGVLVLQVPSTYFVEHIESNYIDLLQKALYRVFGKGTRLEYRALVDKTSGKETQLPSLNEKVEPKRNVFDSTLANPYKKPKLPEIDPQLNPSYNFNNLIEGKSNKLARTAGISISNDPGKTVFNPLFVWGQSGVGKTHLANAIGVMTKQLYPEKRVLYVTANTFQLQYTDAVRNNTVNDFINFYQTIDVLIIDDIQELATKTATQNTYFHIFNHLHQNGKQLVITSDRSPVVMAGMEARLLTRFKWGLNAEIDKPDFNLRKDILKNKIYRDGLEISEEVIDYIANNVVDNVRDLEGTL
ncbi:MAG: chromosomal replication initiator protein DnaA, partial [Paludibacter sp.]|nr:chromosomal replication initiator protein DnaA [Paludibacter sp.]